MIQWLQKNDDDDVECDDNFNGGTDESSNFCKTLTTDKNFDPSIYNLTCAKVHYYELYMLISFGGFHLILILVKRASLSACQFTVQKYLLPSGPVICTCWWQTLVP